MSATSVAISRELLDRSIKAISDAHDFMAGFVGDDTQEQPVDDTVRELLALYDELSDESTKSDLGIVLIEVHGGLASVTECPDGVSYEIRDYDIDGVDEDQLKTDEDGAQYCGS